MAKSKNHTILNISFDVIFATGGKGNNFLGGQSSFHSLKNSEQ